MGKQIAANFIKRPRSALIMMLSMGLIGRYERYVAASPRQSYRGFILLDHR